MVMQMNKARYFCRPGKMPFSMESGKGFCLHLIMVTGVQGVWEGCVTLKGNWPCQVTFLEIKHLV